MSKRDETHAVAVQDGIKVITHKGSILQSRRRLFTLVGCMVGLILIVGGGTVGIVHYIRLRHNASSAQPKTTPSQMALGYVLSGNYAKAQASLTVAIAATSSKTEQANLYIQKAGIASDDADYKNSLLFAQKADALAPSAETAQLIGDAALGLGNKKLALQSYKTQLQRNQSPNQDDKKRIQAQIAAVEAQP